MGGTRTKNTVVTVIIMLSSQPSLRIQVCPKKGITPRILAVRMGWEPDSREGFGFLGHHPHVVSMFLFLLPSSHPPPHHHPWNISTPAARPSKGSGDSFSWKKWDKTLQRQTRNPPLWVRVWKSSKTGCNIPKHSKKTVYLSTFSPRNYPKCKQDWEYIECVGQEAATNPSTSSMYCRIVESHCLSRPGWMSIHIICFQRSRVTTHTHIAHGNPRSPTMKGRIGS